MKTISVLIVFLLMGSSTLLAQVGINTDGSAADPSAMLDVKSITLGFLPPRMTSAQRIGIGTPAEGLMVYDKTGKTMYFYDATNWQEMQFERLWSRITASSKTYLNNTTDSVGIGTNNPVFRLHLWDNNITNVKPVIQIEQTGTGDASLGLNLNVGLGSGNYAIGLDQSHNTFKICDSAGLTGNTYSNPRTMMTISRANPGITHINHQSRARAFLHGINFAGPIMGQPVPWNLWYAVSFDLITWDEQLEYVAGIVQPLIPPPPLNPTPGKFITKEEGYYQINARTEFISWEYQQTTTPSYVSMAIYVNGFAVAYGNKLNIFDVGGARNADNDAPVVCDVIHLNPGDVVEIYVFQNFSNPQAWILGADFGAIPPKQPGACTYVSIHKVS
ncbi:MAG: hypothetical protein M0Q38_02260 [Bacteroidales bacterium]|jgi:hypothetical protein|nr:hypothetical protein [Bacteroidales bacterium]